jgi:hypothetical protein
VIYSRPLNETEKAILLRVFELTQPPDLDALREQVQAGIAVWPCDFPCPSITVAVDQSGHAQFLTRADWI